MADVPAVRTDNTRDGSIFDMEVSDRMCGHVEEENVVLLCVEDNLVNEPYCKIFVDLLELVANFEHIPRLTYLTC
jgi:hypothetical protein